MLVYRLALVFVSLCTVATVSVGKQAESERVASEVSTVLGDAVSFRSIGPFRGGRSAAVTGVPGEPLLYYFGSTGGGVWRTTNGGSTWENISDGYFGGSIGALAVSEWDPNVIYVGGGEKTVRGNVSHGDGVWKSTDAGKTWRHLGLGDTRHIPRIRIHPKNPDLVYVTALGHLFGPNEQRGVFRSKDGGVHWERILFVSADVGAFDLVMDPNNPRILYATTWRVRRTPYSLESGGEGSGLWKSTDGGDTWTEITRNKGLPGGLVGIIGVTVSPVDSNRLWIILESDDGGVFRSDDGGLTWTRVSEDRNLRQRAWYYSRIYAGTQNIDEVYVLNVGFWHSKDGGSSFERIGTPHGDHHDLWIDPDVPERMVIGDDGGAQVTFDKGARWSTYLNQPTAQFYRVTTDDHFPYRIYGAQQDNSTLRVLHRSDGSTITERDWEPTAGGESGHLAPDPEDSEIVYGGSYLGYLERLNHTTRESRLINVWPDFLPGHGAESAKYRFQWNFPLFFSPHDHDTLYAAGNVLFKSTDEGQSWEPISPDLTRNDPDRLKSSGGPITKDNTGVEYYCTIFAALESPHEAGVLWAGTDDGLLHLTRDGGSSWTKVMPAGIPDSSQINSIEAHPTNPGGLYVAATSYKSDDFTPYLYKTADYGESWTLMTDGIAEDHFTRVVRADPNREGLLYAGTERGIYVSFDDGTSWEPFQLNLPVVPITDLAVKGTDLIVATQGRSFWVLDDLHLLHQWTDKSTSSGPHLYEPDITFRLQPGSTTEPPPIEGQNPSSGLVLHYWLQNEPEDGQEIAIEFAVSDGSVIRRFSNQSAEEGTKLTPVAGFNRFVWDLQYPDVEVFPGLILWPEARPPGPRAIPGLYSASLHVGDEVSEVEFEIRPDPRSNATPEDLEAQFEFLKASCDKLSETHRAIKEIRDTRAQIDALLERTADQSASSEIQELAEALKEEMGAVEEVLYQTKNRSPQDVLNYPVALNNRLSSLAMMVRVGDNRPTDQAFEVKNALTAAIDAELAKWSAIRTEQIPEFNRLVRNQEIPAVILSGDSIPAGSAEVGAVDE